MLFASFLLQILEDLAAPHLLVMAVYSGQSQKLVISYPFVILVSSRATGGSSVAHALACSFTVLVWTTIKMSNRFKINHEQQVQKFSFRVNFRGSQAFLL